MWCRVPSSNVTQVRVSEEVFESMVADALDSIPEELADQLENVAVMVQDWPTAAQLNGRSGTLLGLYEGRQPDSSLTDRVHRRDARQDHDLSRPVVHAGARRS